MCTICRELVLCPTFVIFYAEVTFYCVWSFTNSQTFKQGSQIWMSCFFFDLEIPSTSAWALKHERLSLQECCKMCDAQFPFQSLFTGHYDNTVEWFTQWLSHWLCCSTIAAFVCAGSAALGHCALKWLQKMSPVWTLGCLVPNLCRKHASKLQIPLHITSKMIARPPFLHSIM